MARTSRPAVKIATESASAPKGGRRLFISPPWARQVPASSPESGEGLPLVTTARATRRPRVNALAKRQVAGATQLQVAFRKRWRELRDLELANAFAGLPEVVGRLQTQPCLGS